MLLTRFFADRQRTPMGNLGRQLLPLFALAALTGSVALLVDSLHAAPVFCSYDLGCADVLASPYARILGIPLPVVGILVFTAIFGLALLPLCRLERLLTLLTVAAGAGGLVLILVQVLVVGQVCPLCLIVDVSALAGAVARLLSGRLSEEGRLPVWARWGWLGTATGVVGLTATLGLVVAAEDNRPAPEEVRAHWVAGKVNVVEVADFECPICRQMHAELRRLLEREGDAIHLMRLAAPMPKHPNARHAARAYLCAEKAGKAEAMAEALFRADSLSPQSCAQIAARLGIPGSDYRACVADPAIDRDLDATLAWVQEASPRGLPVIWIQDEMLFGLQPVSTLREKVLAAKEQLAHPQ
jgi:uncharacterized membrane protein/protein-disulfide isomerase